MVNFRVDMNGSTQSSRLWLIDSMFIVGMEGACSPGLGLRESHAHTHALCRCWHADFVDKAVCNWIVWFRMQSAHVELHH